MKDNKEVVFMDVDQYQLILDNAQLRLAGGKLILKKDVISVLTI